MLSFLSQWLPSAIVALLMILGSVGILVLRIRANLRRAQALGQAEPSGRPCGCQSACDEHLYQIDELSPRKR